MTAKVRKSVPLDPDDTRDVDLLRERADYREALTAVIGEELPEDPSEAEALHALITAGRTVLREQVMVSGYAALAAAHTDEDRQIAREVSRRARLLGD